MKRRSDGTWSHDVDRFVAYRQSHPTLTYMAARMMFSAIPEDVLKHIFETRKYRWQTQQSRSKAA